MPAYLPNCGRSYSCRIGLAATGVCRFHRLDLGGIPASSSTVEASYSCRIGLASNLAVTISTGWTEAGFMAKSSTVEVAFPSDKLLSFPNGCRRFRSAMEQAKLCLSGMSFDIFNLEVNSVYKMIDCSVMTRHDKSNV